jgi:tRNA pseudouridine38-40 synthase
VSAPEEAPVRTLRLVIEYDGTDFSGWQRQLGQRTVQACLEEALQAMTGQPLRVTGAGRTDAGVHAEGQVASVRVHSRIPAMGLLRGLNSQLPPDMVVRELSDADASFDARRSARGKTYRYQIWNHLTRSPLQGRASWHHRAPLDVHAMREVAAAFVGEHDFRAFRASDCDRKNTVRLIRAFEVERSGALIRCEVEGTAFLKNMVRIMVGTLVQAGHGELDAAGLRRLLEAGDRTKSGVTAPARGLTLVRVTY